MYLSNNNVYFLKPGKLDWVIKICDGELVAVVKKK